jgi:hypothetical protein
MEIEEILWLPAVEAKIRAKHGVSPPKHERPRDPIPDNFDALEQFWEFWDNRSLADYADMLLPVQCKVNLVRRTHMVPVEPQLLEEVAAYAQSRGVSCETLVNLWLQERISARPLRPDRLAARRTQLPTGSLKLADGSTPRT